MNINQELLSRLDALAAKLGTTASHLWAILLHQAYVVGYTDLGAGIVLAAIAVAGGLIGRKMWVKFDDHYAEAGLFGCVLCYFASLGCAIATVNLLYSAITELANPEYFALAEILKAVK